MSAKAVPIPVKADPWPGKIERCCQLDLWKQSVINDPLGKQTINQRLSEHENLKKEIRAQYDTAKPAAEPILLDTESGTVILSAKPFQRKITSEGIVTVYKFFLRMKGCGLKGFLELCREYFPLSLLDQHFPMDKDSLLAGDHTGSRTVKAVARSPIAA